MAADKIMWRRTAVWVGAVLAVVSGVTLLWHSTNWPGAVAARSLVTGFGIAFGARYASTGRIRGPYTATIVIGTLSSAAFFALWTLAT